MKMLEIEKILNVNRYPGSEFHCDFKPNTKSNGGLIAWSMVDDLLHMILINTKTYIYLIAEEPNCDSLRMAYSQKRGRTRSGIEFQSVEILLPHEMSEQEIYNSTKRNDSDIYEEMERENWSSDYGNEDFEWGGLSGEEAYTAMWNCD